MKILKRWLSGLTAGAVLVSGMAIFGNVGRGTLTEFFSDVSELIVSAADTHIYGDLLYVYLNDGTIEISSCDSSATEIEIPSEIDGVTVTSVGYKAFCDCTSLTSIVIPDSVESIGSYVFSGCTKLESVTIGSSVETIGSYAFYNCTNLTSIEIPDSVTSMGDRAITNVREVNLRHLP